MSHCLILQQYDDFYIGADSAGSILIDNKFYRISNDMVKIFKFGSDIYFCSGISNNVELCNQWINRNNSNYIDVENLSSFLKKTFSNKKDSNYFDIEFFICRISNGVSRIYHIAQYNDFNITEYIGKQNQTHIICGGHKTIEGFDYTKKVIQIGKVENIYDNVFGYLADETIGGRLSVYHNNDLFYSSKIDAHKVNTHLVLSDAVVSGYISGSIIKGGELEIGGTGGTFKVHADGSVQILTGSGDSATEKYASTTSINVLKYKTELVYDSATIFSSPNTFCTITCNVYKQDDKTGDYVDITSKLKNNATFTWFRNPSPWTSQTDQSDAEFNELIISNADIERNAQFSCQVQFDTDNI